MNTLVNIMIFRESLRNELARISDNENKENIQPNQENSLTRQRPDTPNPFSRKRKPLTDITNILVTK